MIATKLLTGQYQLSGKCMFCKRPQAVTVEAPDYFQYRNGTFVQTAFPYLDVDQREFIISGMCGKCFDDTFEEEDANEETL